MITEHEVVNRFSGLRLETLQIWIERGWVAPRRTADGHVFREIDVARVGLIYEFSSELALQDETLELVLPLLDQIHGLRHQLHALAQAVSQQPQSVRQNIAQALAGSIKERPGDPSSD